MKIMQVNQWLKHIKVVLVETRHPGNIGGAARAMKNMGLEQLVLVNPKEFPDGKATARAASATDVLESAQVVSSVEEAIQDCFLVVGTSARERRIPWPLLDSHSAAEQVAGELEKIFATDQQKPVAILFGREDRGLTNEELKLCNFHMTIPTNEDYSSLNLAAAVQVFVYELRMACLQANQQESQISVNWDMPPADSQDLERYYEHLETVLERIAFIDPKAPRQVMTRFRRLYHRVRPDEMELAMLRGMLSQIEKSLNKNS